MDQFWPYHYRIEFGRIPEGTFWDKMKKFLETILDNTSKTTREKNPDIGVRLNLLYISI